MAVESGVAEQGVAVREVQSMWLMVLYQETQRQLLCLVLLRWWVLTSVCSPIVSSTEVNLNSSAFREKVTFSPGNCGVLSATRSTG